jgi:Fic family protein
MDGNGRVGRLLIPLFLYEKKITSYPNIYISEFLEEYRDIYYKLLRNVSEKEEWVPWLNFFLDAIFEQTKKTFGMVEKIEKLYRSLKKIMPKVNSVYADLLLDAIFVKPTFTVKTIKNISGISNNQTLYSIIEKFVDLKIIKDITPNSARNKIYVFSALKNITR